MKPLFSFFSYFLSIAFALVMKSPTFFGEARGEMCLFLRQSVIQNHPASAYAKKGARSGDNVPLV